MSLAQVIPEIENRGVCLVRVFELFHFLIREFEGKNVDRNVFLPALAGLHGVKVYLFDFVVGHRETPDGDAIAVYAYAAAEVGGFAF